MKYTASPARSHTDASSVVTALAALAQETRLAIFRLLVEHALDGLTPGAIALRLKLPPTTLSFHLKELANAGLIEDRRAGRMQANLRAQEEQVMRRFHVHLGVPDLAASIRFYSDLFGMPPSVEKPDYAKWMIEDPRVNFAISHRGSRTGLNHLGLQAESADELAAIRAQFSAADVQKVSDEPNVKCCYARGNKHWTQD